MYWTETHGREVYWTETHGGQLLGGPKIVKSCSVYQEEEAVLTVRMSAGIHFLSPVFQVIFTINGHQDQRGIPNCSEKVETA